MSDSLIGRTIADRYHVEALLGEGGMGHVYLAEHVLMGRKVAVKVMHPSMAKSPDAISRFHREAANASRINHPNVAAIHDFGDFDGTLYLVMELIEGETLTALLNRVGPLPLARAASLLEQAASALAAAHHLEIVHRDLKPDNIMIGHQHDGRDWVKIVDFGIAKTTTAERGSQTVTTAGVSIGTPEYMSPEQLAGERLDARSDIYALGLVLYNMLTGALPFPPMTSKETLVRRLTAPPRSLRDARPDVAWPSALETAIARALAPEAGDRYASASDFARDVTTAALAPVVGPVGTVVPAGASATVRTAAPSDVPATRQPTVVLAAAAERKHPSRPRPWLAIAAVLLVAVLGGLAWRGGVGRRLTSDRVAAAPPERAAAQGASRRGGRAPAPPTGLDDLRARLRRTTDLLASGEPLRARAAYREAQAALLTFRKSHDDPESLRQLQAITAEFRREANEACLSARSRAGSPAAAAQYPCEAPLQGAPVSRQRRGRRHQ